MAESADNAEPEEFEDFLCTCSDEGKDRSEAVLAEVKARLAGGSDELQPFGEVTDRNFLTAVVTSLNWDFDARITQIANDQWSGVWAEAHDGKFKTRIQCDEVEHGIAATWKAFADRKLRLPTERVPDDH